MISTSVGTSRPMASETCIEAGLGRCHDHFMAEQFVSRARQWLLGRPAGPGFGGVSYAATWALLVACSSTGQGGLDVSGGAGSAGTNESARQPSSLCPSCAPTLLAGGETSDFGGLGSACAGDAAPLPDDGEVLAQIDQLQHEYAGGFDTSLRWAPGGGFSLDDSPPPWLAPPSGYDVATRLSARVELGEPIYVVGRPLRPEHAGECPNWLYIPASVELSTEDGALSARLQGSVSTNPGSVRTLWASGDLANATGLLDLHLDPGQEPRGQVDFALLALPEGKRGSLEIRITPSSASEGAVSAYPIAATFPDDGCEPREGFPVATDTPLPDFGGESALGLVNAWRETLDARELEGIWSDCSRTGVRIELEVPVSVCSRSASPAWSPLVSITAPNRIYSTDGRLDVRVTGMRLEDGQLSLHTGGPDEPIPAAEFAARGGVAGVDPGDSAWLATSASAQFDREAASNDRGSVHIEELECRMTDDCVTASRREILRWPSGSGSVAACQ